MSACLSASCMGHEVVSSFPHVNLLVIWWPRGILNRRMPSPTSPPLSRVLQGFVLRRSTSQVHNLCPPCVTRTIAHSTRFFSQRGTDTLPRNPASMIVTFDHVSCWPNPGVHVRYFRSAEGRSSTLHARVYLVGSKRGGSCSWRRRGALMCVIAWLDQATGQPLL